LINGPLGTLLVAGAAMIALIIWLRRDRSYPGPRLHGEEGIDRAAAPELTKKIATPAAHFARREACAGVARTDGDRARAGQHQRRQHIVLETILEEGIPGSAEAYAGVDPWRAAVVAPATHLARAADHGAAQVETYGDVDGVVELQRGR